MRREYSFSDRLCIEFDRALRTLSGIVETTSRANPALEFTEPNLTAAQQQQAASLMRINHVGEICAQALYHGQALTAKSEAIRQQMHQAALEENDHLQWCAVRLRELNSRPSYLNPFWYTASFAMGAIAGLAGDRWSLGFVVETEYQVERHLAEHLQTLPTDDSKSRAIITQMQLDEMHHATTALENGAAILPQWIKTIMRWQSKVMTTTAYWI